MAEGGSGWGGGGDDHGAACPAVPMIEPGREGHVMGPAGLPGRLTSWMDLCGLLVGSIIVWSGVSRCLRLIFFRLARPASPLAPLEQPPPVLVMRDVLLGVSGC